MAMELIPKTEFNPFQEMAELNRSFQKVMERVFTAPSYRRAAEGEGVWCPDADILETDDSLMVHLAMPGVEKKDIHLEVSDNTLIVRGERKEPESRGKTWLRQEQEYGPFYRAIRLPAEVYSGKVKASEEHGVLEITLPKAEESKTRRIEID